MGDPPSPKWRDLASKASTWTLKAAKEAGIKGADIAKATDKRVREELERRKQTALDLKEQQQREAEAKLERERLDLEERHKVARAEAIAREPGIRAFYDNRLNTLHWRMPGAHSWEWENKTQYNMRYGEISLSRSLSSVASGEVEILRYAELLKNFFFLDDNGFANLKLSIIYNNGNCQKHAADFTIDYGYSKRTGLHNEADAIQHRLAGLGCANKEAAIEKFLAAFSAIETKDPTAKLVREFHRKLIGGSNWISNEELAKSGFSTSYSATSLFIGATDSRQPVWYEGEGSIVSVAPPGSGKTQCHVFPNLVSYRGPVIVLDVKGECFDQTSAWRKANVGPVFRFSPLNPATSARYNPLAFLIDDPDVLWEECRMMADLLIVPQDKNDPSWENRARDVVAGIMAWLVRHKPPEERAMGRIVDVLAKIDWDEFIADAKFAVEIPPLSRLGNALAVMPDKQLEGVLDAARRHLAVWEGSRVERVTSACDWTPNVLRDGSNSTVYICIPPSEIESYAALLRVLFAQHLRHLMRELPKEGQTPILFMLDELPRLGPMKPVEEALEVGRQYGIRLWMFAQSLGQFERAYGNAEGMIGSCAMRIYMNPSSHDGTAKRLSEELGFAENILDGSRRLIIEPSTLAGPDYADYQIVLGRNVKPAKLSKVFAFREEAFKSRMA